MAVNIEFREITVGPAVNFRQDINYNFSLIKNEIEDVLNDVQQQISDLNKTVDDKLENFKGGIDIKLQKNQPTDQKQGDYWFKIL